jgi:hypothetical protein
MRLNAAVMISKSLFSIIHWILFSKAAFKAQVIRG